MRSTTARRIVPETIQTSAMDCGPAALRSLLAGFDVQVGYGGLREACRTDVDGTSIDALEVTATGLGLDCAQLMLPVDHVLLGNLPALLVVVLPSGMPHFVIGWRRHGPYVQVMDPAAGRMLLRARAVESMLYVHEQPVPATAWASYAAGESFRDGLRARLRRLGLRTEDTERRIAAAGDDWHSRAVLDAAVRALASRPGRHRDAGRRLDALTATPDDLPERAWFARPLAEPGPDGAERVMLRGAVLLRARGPADDPPDSATLSADLQAALRTPVARPAHRLLDAARTGGTLPWRSLVPLAVLAGGLVVAETAVLRGALDGDRPVRAIVAGLVLAVVLAAVEAGLAARVLTLGRRLEGGLRWLLAARLPLLPDRYLRSRPASDMAGRAHQLHELRTLPLLLGQAATTAVELVVLAVALVVLHPPAAPLVVAATVLVGLAAGAVQPPLREREQRHREHAAALAQLELDGVLAVHPVRSLGGAPALAAEHAGRLVHWRAAALASGRTRTTAALTQGGLGAALAVAVVLATLPDLDRPATQLLFVLWALGVPLAGERLALLAQQWPSLRTLALRLAEPLDTPAEDGAGRADDRRADDAGEPVHLRLRGVGAVAVGRPVLQDVDLELAPGEHVAVVGSSGSGKSTLMALLLGLQQPSAGQVLVDGAPLDRAAAERLWPAVAWVDPQVRVWNRPLIDNVGQGRASAAAVQRALEAAELGTVEARVGDQPLGDDGGLLSGGEAQRVRLARALAQDGVRMVVLDEALRGLDRGQRSRLLVVARQHWAAATLLCATHDLRDAAGFDRVLVIDGGRVVEDGAPAELAACDGSRFRALLDAEESLRADLDGGTGWRRLHVAGGTVRELARPRATPDFTRAAEPCTQADLAAEPQQRAPQRPAAPAGQPAGRPWRSVALLAAYAGVQLARLVAFLASWVVVGRAITDGEVSAGQLAPWAALVGAAAGLAALGSWLEGRFATEASQVLRRRLLRGVFGVDPEHVHREGAGRLLGRIMEIEPVAALAATGGLQALIAAVEVLGALAVLLAVPVGRPLAGVLLVLVAAAGVLVRVHARRLVAETDLRLLHTGRLLEDLAGQRTRRVQAPSDGDPRMDAYRQAGAAADRTMALVSVGPARLWQVLALGALGLSVIASDPSGSQLAAALGGVLLASAGLRRAGVAGLGLTTAAVALRELGPLLRFRPYVPTLCAPPVGTVLSARDVTVRRGQAAVLTGATLAVAPGDRVLLSGASGSSKSTLVEALAGLRPVAAGRVDGRAALAPQFCDDHILLAPLAFNLLLARGWPAQDGDVQAAWELCGELGLGGLLRRMPAGLAQVVGETGWQLSNGERALVGLARALLAEPDVLVVDESLGPIDSHTARRALQVAQTRVRTLVVVTQE